MNDKKVPSTELHDLSDEDLQPRLSTSALSQPKQDWQSSAFSVSLAVNPIVAMAMPLLTMATQLRDQTTAPDFAKLLTSLSHEVKVFENRAHSAGYRSQVILAARYFLCALTDEFILATSWGKKSDWQEKNLLTNFQRENRGGERFFTILERSAEDPMIYIDVLELGYICLSLGFQGKYRNEENKSQLGILIDNLYDLIRSSRGEVAKNLLVASKKAPLPPKIMQIKPPPVWVTILIALGFLAAIFIPYYHRLHHLTKPIAKSIQTLGTDHAQSN